MTVILNSVLAAGLSALVAGIFWLVGWRFRRAFLWFSALAIGVAFPLLYWLTLGKPELPPTDATHWLFWYALLLVPLGWLAGIRGELRWLGGWALLLGLPWLYLVLFLPLIQNGYWSLTVGVAWVLAFGIGSTLLAWWVAPQGEEAPGISSAFLLAMLGGVSAGVLFYNAKSSSLAQLAGLLGTTVGVGVILGLLWRNFRLGRGAVMIATVLYSLLWAVGFAYGNLSAPMLGILALSTLSLGLPYTPLGLRWSPLVRFLVPLLVLVLFGGGAVAVSFQAYMASAGDYPY